MSEWIKCKDRLPTDGLKVVARNPHCEAVSWIDGVNELGKPKWHHYYWAHADDFVVEWRHLTQEEQKNI